MFDGLDDVDWGSYRHAYGAAVDIPQMLRAWVDGDRSASRAAVSNLWSSLFHQGDLHPTAAVVAPFFVEALRSGSDAVFADAYFFLDHMLDPMTPAWEADGFSVDQHESPPCYRAAASALDVLLACLDPGPSARLAGMLDPALISRQVAQTLWWFPESADAIADAVRRRLDAVTNPTERTPLLLCLAMQDRHLGDPVDHPMFLRAAHAAHPGERLAGVMALARIRRLDTDGDELDLLRSALDRPAELGYPIEDTQGSLATGEQLVSDALLAAVVPEDLTAEELTELQYEVTEAVADRAAEGVEDLLEFYGL